MLITSKTNAARSQNVATEIHAGKSRAQAVAIAYSVQRKARAHKATLEQVKKDRRK